MTNLQGKKLVIFDLDGTLTPAKEHMKPSMAQALSELLKRIKVAVISGGGYPRMQTQFLRSLPHTAESFGNLYILPTSGTRLYMWQGDWQERYHEDLSREERKRIMEAFRPVLMACKHSPEKIYGELIEDRLSQVTFSGLGQEAPIDTKKQWDPDHRKREAIIAALRPKLPEFDIRIGGTTSIDVTRRGVNKAYGIHKLEQYLGIPISEMIFVGDALFYGGNDYPAKAAGVDCIEVKGPEDTEKIIRNWFVPSSL